MLVGELNAVLTADSTQFDRVMGRAKTTMGALTGVVGGGVAATAGLVGSLAKVGTSYNTLQQQSQAALTTLLGSTQAADSQLQKFNDFARKSPFAKDVFITAQQQLLGFGMAANKVIPSLDAIQNAVAATGGSNQQIAELSYILAQVSAAGKVTGQDLLQFGQRGVDAATLVGSQMGKTGQEIRDMITAGKLSAQDFTDYLTKGMMAKYKGAASNLKGTYVGAADRIKGAFRDIGSAIAAPFVDPKGGGYLVTWFNDIADVMRAFESQAEPIISAVMDRWAGALDKVSPALQSVTDKLKSLDTSDAAGQIDSLLDSLSEFAPLLGTVAGSLVGFIDDIPVVGGVLSKMGLSFNPLLTAMGGLILATPEVRNELGNLMGAITPLIGAGSEIAGVFASFANDTIKQIAPDLVELAGAITKAVTPLMGDLVPAAKATVSVLEPIVGIVSNVVHWFSQLPSGVIAAGSALVVMNKGLGLAKSGFSEFVGTHPRMVSGLKTLSGVFREAGENMQVASTNGMGKFKSAMTGAGTIAQKAGAGITGMVKSINPLGAVLTIASVALGIFAQKQQEAAERTQRIESNAQELASTLSKTSGAFTEATGAVLENQLAAQISTSDLQELGLTYEDVAQAAMGNADAIERVNKAREASRHDVYNGPGATEYNKESDAAQHLGDVLGDTKKAIRGAADESERSRKIQEAEAGAIEGVTDKLKAQKDARDKLAGGATAYSQALGKQTELQKDAAEALKEYVNQQVGLSKSGSGFLDETTEAGNAYNQVLQDMSENAKTMVSAMQDMGKSTEEQSAAMRASRDQFISTAEQMGLTKDQAAALADQLGLIPSEVTTNAYLDINEAINAKDNLIASINTASGTVTINGQSYKALDVLNALKASINESSGTVTLNGNNLPAYDVLRATIEAVQAGKGTVTINGNSYDANKVLAALLEKVRGSKGTVSIGADASGAVAAARRAVGTINGMTAYITTGTKFVGGKPGNLAQADGGWVGPGIRRYAANGLTAREAMFAPGGSWITWAEDETQGEWYIPAALSKRKRSTRILQDVATSFGYTLIPRDSKHAADGATPATTTGGTGNTRLRLVLANGQELDAYLETVAAGVVVAADKEKTRWRSR